ncbi:MAG: hypothetical protein ABI823_19435, partial [Bryobacteraceae bacterium]
MVRLFRAGLLPRGKAGRKLEERTAVAAGLFVAGMEEYATRRSGVSLPSLRLYQRTLWQRIYCEVLPGVERMDKLTWQYRTGTLRRNVKAYLRRQGCKWSRGIAEELVSTID